MRDATAGCDEATDSTPFTFFLVTAETARSRFRRPDVASAAQLAASALRAVGEWARF